MKTPARILVAVCAVGLTSVTAYAQTTITAAQVAAEFAVGRSIVTNNDTTTTSLNIGAPGSTSWDFSGLQAQTTTTLTSISVGSSPYAANFPGTTHVLTAPVSYIGIPGTGYQHIAIGTNVMNLGSEAGFVLSGLGTADATIVNSPTEELYALPSTFGTSWSSSFTVSTVAKINGSVVSSSSTTHNYAYVVDAYGLMKMPGGTFSDALRIKRTDTGSSQTVAYVFLAGDGALVQVTAADILQPTSGVISVVRKSITWTASDPSLPIQLASFRASVKPAGEGIELRWSTMSELENYGFNVQRRSGATGDFSEVAGSFVPGHGTTSQPWSYSFVDAAPPSGTLQYRLEQVDLDGSRHYTDPVEVNSVTGIRAASQPAEFRLDQNYPNPFNPATTITFSVGGAIGSGGGQGAAPSLVRIAVYDLLGREVAVLASGNIQAGTHSVRFDAGNLPGGVYLCRMQTPEYTRVIRMVLLK
jgi:hypothetical protein